MSQPSDLLFGVLASRLGFCTADDVLAASRELVGQGDARLADVLERRGLLDAPARAMVERLAARAVQEGGGDPARPLALLPRPAPSAPRHTPDPMAHLGEAAAVDEQPGRYAEVLDEGGQPRVLGRGRSGVVQLWEDHVLGRPVAVKLDAPDERLLFDEARLTGHLDHPAVVPVYELGRRPSGAPYYTMQRVEGRTLTDAIAAAASLDERLALLPAFAVACRCIAAAHAERVVHRDLSSDHVMLGRFGEVYLLDWGRARREEQRSEERRVDLKCLGDMLTALLAEGSAAGRPLRGAPSDLLAIGRRTRLPPQEGGFESVEALCVELEAFLDGRRVASHRYSAFELVRRFLVRNPVFAAGVGAVVALLVVVALVAQARVRDERDRARLFAQRFLDDVAASLVAVPGVESLVQDVTSRAVAHYERTTELDRAPEAERRRVAEAMLRLADVSLSLGRGPDAASALAFARRLADGLRAGSESVDVLLLLARCGEGEARLAGLPGQDGEREEALVRQALDLVGRALAAAPDDVRANVLAAELERHLSSVVDEGGRPILERAIARAGHALAIAPGDLDAQLAQARNLSLLAFMPEVALDPAGRRANVERALGLLRDAQRRAPDSGAVRDVLANVLVQWATVLELDGELEKARAALEEARETALALLRAQPDSVAIVPTLVEAEVNLGLVQEAWRHVRTLEQQGALAELALVAPATAFLAGDDDEAIRLAQRPGVEATGAALVYRAMAAAMKGKPGDAVIAARAARGKVQYVPWRRGLAYARVVHGGHLERPLNLAVLRFTLAYDAALPVTDVAPLDAALDRFIADLEALLAR